MVKDGDVAPRASDNPVMTAPPLPPNATQGQAAGFMMPQAPVVPATTTGQTLAPATASDDADVIEEEWVAIVRKLIQEHQDDPYLLMRSMALLKADYLKKRYDKEVKVPEETK